MQMIILTYVFVYLIGSSRKIIMHGSGDGIGFEVRTEAVGSFNLH